MHQPRAWRALAGCLLLVVSSNWQCSAEDSHPAIGKQLSDFALTDFRGKVWKPDDFGQADVLVVAFLGVECPLAKLYTERLQDLKEQWGSKVAILGVDANLQDSMAELNAHARAHKIEFPLTKDVSQSLLHELHASRTPEVFVLDRQRRVQYCGRVDDQYGIGYVREKPESNELLDAVSALLKGETVRVPFQPAVGCRIGLAKHPQADSEVTYSNQIARVFREHCIQCHRDGEIGPFALTNYDEIVGWAEMILEVVEQRRMPPWHAAPSEIRFANDCSLDEDQIAMIRTWVENGAPEGDRTSLPPPKQFVEGWQLPQTPDLVIPVSSKPYRVPAEGEVKYQYFRAEQKFDEEKWVKAIQILPGNRSVVHHILVFVRPVGATGNLAGERGFLAGYVPGSYAAVFPEGMAKKIPAGSELIFQVHYTPTGTEQWDQSQLGIVFADPDTVFHEVKTTSAVQSQLRIPPGAENYHTSAMLPEELPECQLLTMAPHMHLRGKSFSYKAIIPNGEDFDLLQVPAYDFNWQTAYRLSEPISLPAGSKIFCEAEFDNSVKNLNNPDPTATVRWGDQTNDEMMIGYFDIVVPKDSEALASSSQRRRALVAQIVKQGLFERLDSNRDQRIELDEVPQRWKDRFSLLDTNQDGFITTGEMQK